MTEPKKMDLKSMDIPEDKREQLRQFFPEVFTEKKIDFEKLKLALGEMMETGKERYGFNWAGKADCFKIIQQPSVGTLKPCREESVNFDDTENLFIEGDNLEVLKLLQKAYYGRVKMISIDPPYNTGNDFIYPDNYSESLDTYLKYTGQVDPEGRKYSTNTEADGRFHTKWINMMYPRLYLAKNLLREDGVIFINIDDGEVANLRKICDEIFGEENFVTTIIWQKRITPENRRTFSFEHDYIICFAKSAAFFNEARNLFPLTEEARSRYRNPDNDPRGVWQSVPAIAQAGHGTKSQFYKLKTPNGKYHDPPSGCCWRYNELRMLKEIENNNIWFGEDGNGVPRIKRFLEDTRQGITPSTLWMSNVASANEKAKRELMDLFSGATVFDSPKPNMLIQRMLLIATNVDTKDIILDFFSGSATTAHAVLALNKQDNGNRKFIMVQLPEPCGEESEAFKAGYKTIAEIGKERIRRVIKSISGEEEGRLGYDKSKQDLGFKVIKLAKSNFKIWDTENAEDTEKLGEQLELHVDHIDPNSTQEDILYELLLKSGFDLATKIEKLTLAGKTVYSIADGDMIICLEEKLTKEVIIAIAEMTPSRVICLDKGFKDNDQLKANAGQIMKSKKVNTFLTV